MKRWLNFFGKAISQQKHYFIFTLFVIAFISLISSFSTIVIGYIMNTIQQFELNEIKMKVLVLFVILLICNLLGALLNILRSNLSLKSNYKLKKYTSKLYIDILNKMDYLNMNKSDYRRSLDIISNELTGNSCINDFMLLFSSLFSSIVSIFIIGAFTVEFNIFLLIVLVLIFVLSLFTGIIKSKMYLNKRNSIMSDIREENYLASLFDNLNSSREFLFFPFQNLIMKKWTNKYKENNKILIKEKNKGEIFNIISILIIISLVFIYLFIISKGDNNIMFGSFFIVLLAILNISNNVMHLGLICNRFYISSKNLQEIDKLNSNLNDIDYNSIANVSDLIEFNNVSFKYTDVMILKNINIKINKGEKIGIVGVNGCGKSTLIKLLCGLYQPTEGEISVFGQNCYKDLMHKKDIPIATVMQDFSIYEGYTLEENITLGNDKPNYENYSNLGNIQNIIDKKDMLVGERFDGTNLSKGQWQLASILRAINSNKDIIVLDEPTASLDPIAEKQVYEEFLKLNCDKTLFVITHRLASVKNVDRILYIEDGKIAECGSHDELMKVAGGKYRSLFNEQAKWYKEEK